VGTTYKAAIPKYTNTKITPEIKPMIKNFNDFFIFIKQ